MSLSLVGQVGQTFESKTQCGKEDKIVLYCRSGMRAGNAARALAGQGFTNVVVYPGGVSEWKSKSK